MIEMIDKNNNYSQSKLALRLNRYKKQRYTIIGVGYPFFYNELLGLVKMCDFFVDDMDNQATEHWRKRYNIKDISALQQLDKAIIIVLSLNRYSILTKIISFFPHIEIIYAFKENKNYVLTSEEEIEKLNLFTYKKSNTSMLKIENAVLPKKGSALSNISNKQLKIGYIEFGEESKFRNNSRYENEIDTLILSHNSQFSISLDGKANIKNCYIGESSKINVYSGELNIGDVYFGMNCIVHVYKELNIGSGTIISWNVSILDGDGHSLYIDGERNIPKRINIEDNVWIGNNVTILKGVTIGTGSVIGAGSIVTKSISENSLALGNPARVVKSNVKWEYKYSF